MRRRTRTTTEKHEVWVVRRAQEVAEERSPDSCTDCGGPARMLAPEEAAALSGLNTRAVYALVVAGRAHFNERPDGKLFVCLASLSAARD
ncbi:MAG: hypothetical protein M3430_03885 [Acidobacteriota bacterium]|nr:hypothetical protein [Acidobacteriota bacterium]